MSGKYGAGPKSELKSKLLSILGLDNLIAEFGGGGQILGV